MIAIYLLFIGLSARLAQGMLFSGDYNHFKRQIDIDRLDWSTIEPSRNLSYTDCVDGFQCARLLAPLDWSLHGDSPCGLGDLDANNSVALAIIKLPASVPETDPSFGGTVMWNPGGPGGMAVIIAQIMSPMFQDMLDGSKHYEIVTFDPRGVGESTPQIKCFDHLWQRYMAMSKAEESISPRHGRAAVATQLEQQAAIGEICMEAGPDSIHAHSGSASVARDMLHIVDKVEEERMTRLGPAYEPADGKPRLQYIGLSYGTTLGSYFASMFPGRVGRMLLGGLVDSESHRYGAGFDNIEDSEAAIENVYEYCFETSCAFRLDTDTGPEDIKARVQATLDWLDETPVSNIQNKQIAMIRSVILRRWLFWISYSWDDYMAARIAVLLSREFSSEGQFFSPEDFEESPFNTPFAWGGDAATVIGCLDMQLRKPDMDIDWAHERYKTMEAEAPTAAEFRYLLAMRCARWAIEPAYDFQEPFGAPPPDPDLAPDAPAAPLFLLSNRYDPATPLAQAWTVSRQYPNSSVMILEVAGHDPFERAGECTLDAVRAYFEDGVVPPNGTTCEPAPTTHGGQSAMFPAMF